MLLRTLKWLLQSRKSAGQSAIFNIQMLAKPYIAYQQLRSTDPVHWDAPNSRWVLTRYADVVSVLRNPVASSDRNQYMLRVTPPGMRELFTLRSNTMLNCDAPKHSRLRLLVSKAFTARAVEAMTGNIQRMVDGFLDGVQSRGRMDVIADLAYPLPVTVIAEILGVPAKDRDQFKHWSDDLAIAASGGGSPSALRLRDYRKMLKSYRQLVAYLSKVVAQRRAEPRDDILSALVQAEEAGDRLSEDELYANATLLLVAGHETTTNLIGNGTLALLRHPEQMERLKRDPSLIPTAVEEFLRFDSPVQFVTRLLKNDLSLGGKQLRNGQLVLLLLGAANHDPEQFPNADQLDVGRAENKHVAFGLGTHFCLGAQLARLEGRIVFETLLRRMPNLRLEQAEPTYREHFNLRGLKSLPVAF